MGIARNAQKILIWKPEGKIQLGRLKHEWEVSIKMDLRKIELMGMDWIQLAQDREEWWSLVKTVMNILIP
jgi:hypothetical protein